ncbi:unnamed protein product [Arabidopsis halleri]
MFGLVGPFPLQKGLDEAVSNIILPPFYNIRRFG